MTTQESFKHRIRARMAKTGERYSAARRALLAKAEPPAGRRGWVSDPDTADTAIRERTGRGWDEWVGVIDAGPGREAGHTAIARWLVREHGVDGWWAQNVTVGYERITGLRLPGQMADGTFRASRSRTLDASVDQLRRLLLDDEDRTALFPGMVATLRSRPSTKALRVGLADPGGEAHGVVLFSFDPAGERVRLTVTHDKLPTAAAAAVWKEFWGDWLDALAGERP
jgi:hypothetical protein